MKTKKKLVIRDHYHKYVLVDTIASFYIGDTRIMTHLRNGQKINLDWATRKDAEKAAKILLGQFDILEVT